MERIRPTRKEVLAAAGRTVPDVIGPALRVLFCGINPGLYTAAVGHHFARPGNRFWTVLHLSGFTERVLLPEEERLLLSLGYGITNLVSRATAAAEDLTRDELRDGRRVLDEKVSLWRPERVAVVGIGAFRQAFLRPQTGPGPQPERLAGARVWVLPNPSGLNATYQLEHMVDLFAALRRDVGTIRP